MPLFVLFVMLIVLWLGNLNKENKWCWIAFKGIFRRHDKGYTVPLIMYIQKNNNKSITDTNIAYYIDKL